jgi:hypothetical protein
MNADAIDRMVLEARREIAKTGAERHIGGRRTRLAGPKDGDCTYLRIALEVDRRSLLPRGEDALNYGRQLEESLLRLRKDELVFVHEGGPREQRSFWVVMSE